MSENAKHIDGVSVVMCTYNGEQFLRQQLDSVLAQDYPLHEIVIEDDGSTDGTWALLTEYQRKHPQLIKLFRNEKRLGFNRNFHTAMLRATGDFIAISDQDDIWFPQKVRRQVEAIGDCDLCFSDKYDFWDENMSEATPTNYYIATLYSLLGKSAAGHTMLVRTDFVRSIGHWDLCFVYDWWLTLHALFGHGVVKVAEPLNYHRKHYSSVTTNRKKKVWWHPTEHATWQPYVEGYFYLHRFQKRNDAHTFYAYFAQHIDASRFPAEAKLVHLMLKHNPFATLRLCILCARYYRDAYKPSSNRLKWRIHAFFAPFIMAYYEDKFDRYKY